MLFRAQLIAKIADALCWVAIGLAFYWIAFKDDRFAPYVAMTFLAGLASGAFGYLFSGYQSDFSSRKQGFWRHVARFLAIVFIGGAGLSLFIYLTSFHDHRALESFRQTVLTLTAAQLALGTLALLAVRRLK